MPGDWLRSLVAFLLFLQSGWTCPNLGQLDPDSDADSELLAEIEILYQSGQWGAVIERVSAASSHVAELDYYRGMALARLQRWQEASQAFENGERKMPAD